MSPPAAHKGVCKSLLPPPSAPLFVGEKRERAAGNRSCPGSGMTWPAAHGKGKMFWQGEYWAGSGLGKARDLVAWKGRHGAWHNAFEVSVQQAIKLILKTLHISTAAGKISPVFGTAPSVLPASGWARGPAGGCAVSRSSPLLHRRRGWCVHTYVHIQIPRWDLSVNA